MLESEHEPLRLHKLTWEPESKPPKALQPGPYESKVAEIKSQRGDLESIRGDLGLSRRKIAELLLVDPSAWTRWTKGVSRVPAHVYQSLDWYIRLTKVDPQIREKMKVDRVEKELVAQREQFQSDMEGLKSEIQSENWREERRKLLSQLESAEKISFAWKAFLVITFLLALL